MKSFIITSKFKEIEPFLIKFSIESIKKNQNNIVIYLADYTSVLNKEFFNNQKKDDLLLLKKVKLKQIIDLTEAEDCLFSLSNVLKYEKVMFLVKAFSNNDGISVEYFDLIKKICSFSFSDKHSCIVITQMNYKEQVYNTFSIEYQIFMLFEQEDSVFAEFEQSKPDNDNDNDIDISKEDGKVKLYNGRLVCEMEGKEGKIRVKLSLLKRLHSQNEIFQFFHCVN